MEEKKDTPEVPQTATDFIDDCVKNKCEFMLFRFDRENKKYIGVMDKNIDQTQALITIKTIAMRYGITPQLVVTMLTQERQKAAKGKLITLPKGLTKPDGKTPLN